MSRDMITVGSTMRIPLLYQGEYLQWRKRFMNYLEEQTDGEAMINSIQNGDQPLPINAQVSLAGNAQNAPPTLKDPKFWTAEEKKTWKIDRLARSLLIQGLPNDIYSLIDSNETAKNLWDALERQMHGSEYGEQDRTACGYKKDNCELNYKFLNNLQPECKQYATLMRQTKNLMDINIDALYNILKQNQGDVNEALGYKKKAVVVTSDPLALVTEKTKEGHFAKDSKKAKVKDYNYYKTKMLLAKKDSDKKVLLAEDQVWIKSSSDSDQEINANMVFMAQIEKVFSESDESSSSAEETIAEVAYYTSESESEYEFETSEYYDNSTSYSLFVNNNDDQEIFHDAIESAIEKFIKNHIDSQKDYDKSEVYHNDFEEKEHLVDKLIQKFNHKIAKCQKRIQKKNNVFNEQIKVLNEKNADLLAQTKVLKDQLKVKHVVIGTHTECQAQYAKLEEERYEYMIRYSALCDNDIQHRKKINEQEILFDKIRQLVEMNNNVLRIQEKILEKETKISELKGYVSNKDDEIEKFLERLNECFENSSYFEKAKDLRHSLYDEKVISLGYTLMFPIHSDEALEIEKFKRARENKIEFAYNYGNLNASYVNEKINFSDDYFQEIINPNFEKIDSPFQQTSLLKPYVANVILEKDIIDLEDEVASLLEKEKANLKTIESLKSKECNKVENSKEIAPGMFKLSVSQSVTPISMSITSCESKNVEKTSSVYVCNDAMNVSCNSRMRDLFDDHNFFIFDDESVRISPVSKMPFRKKPRDSMNVCSKSNLNKSLPRTVHKWLPKLKPLPEPIVYICLWIIDSGCSNYMTGNHALLTNFVEKFLGTVRFGNNDFAVIAGYGDVVIGSMTIKKVYYVEGLGHNLFSKTQVNLQLQVQRVRTDNGTKFKNKTLAKFFDEVGVTQQFSAARTPQQNGVMERRNRTLVEAARTMLTFVNLPLFLWAEAIAIACFTQNRLIIHKRFDKTPFELMNKRKPNIKFFRVFGCRCYLLNDYEDVGKLKAKGDIIVFVGYSKESVAFRIYNKQTRKIHESVNIMKSSTTNVETSINEEVFHEVSESFQRETSSSSLNDDVQKVQKKNNREAHLDFLRHLKESVETIREIVEEAKVVSKAVDEIVTDAVNWAIQAPLQNRFRDLPEAEIKEIFHQRMWENNSYKTHEDHVMLYEALEKSMNRDHSEEFLKDLAKARKKKKKRRDSPKMPPGSPPHPPPPPGFTLRLLLKNLLLVLAFLVASILVQLLAVEVPETQTTPASIRDRTYDDLIEQEKIREACDIRETNTILQGLPQDIYNLMNYHTEAKEIWDRVKLFIHDNGDIITIGQASQEGTTTTIFQTVDLDVFDSDCDEAPLASAVLMAKPSAYD
nr:retrovirus-related Pol polyprotein from transposon TNT 1-94 [Tanacetum cinerariifolium]